MGPVRTRRLLTTAVVGAVLMPLAVASSTPAVPSMVAVGPFPYAVAVSADGGRAYVTHGISPGKVAVVDTTSGAVVADIAVADGPDAIAVSADGTRAYVTSLANGTVSAIDTTRSAVIGTYPVGDAPMDIAISPDGTRLYVAAWGEARLVAVDSASGAVVARTRVPGIYGVAVSPDGSTVYGVTSAPRTAVVEVDALSHGIVRRIDVGPRTDYQTDMAVGANGLVGYVIVNRAPPRPAAITVVDLGAGAVGVSIPVASVIYGVDVTADGARVLVTSRGPGASGGRGSGGLVSVIDTSSNTVVGTLANRSGRGADADAIAAVPSPDGRTAYVSLYGSRFLGVYDLTRVPRTPSQPRTVRARWSNSSGSSGSSASVVVTWTAPQVAGDRILEYRVILTGVVEGPGAPVRICRTTKVTCTVRGLEPGLAHEVVVQARNALGWGPVAQGRYVGRPSAG